MDKNLYDMIFKRKSFHTFKNTGDEHISQEELQDIEEKFSTFVPLVEGMKFERTLYVENDPKGEKNLTASYLLTGSESC